MNINKEHDDTFSTFTNITLKDSEFHNSSLP